MVIKAILGSCCGILVVWIAIGLFITYRAYKDAASEEEYFEWPELYY
jgi:hypothetical protein